ncbi:MAG: cation:proton antiporter [Halobacteriales archaeon]|nr:cation:proton antiporter [Halobacteriales archaeon]
MVAAESLLLVAGIVFTAVATAGSIAWSAKQSVIPAYLIVGILIGPNAPTISGVSLTLVEGGEFIDLFSELGIVFLLFFIGVEFSVSKLLADPTRLLKAGGVDFVVGIALGIGLGLALGFSFVESLFIAGIIYPSSSAVITKSLIDLGWIADPESEVIMGVLVFEDVVMALYLAGLAAVTLGGDLATVAVPLAESVGILIIFGLLAAFGTELLGRLLATRSDEIFLLRIIALTTLLSGIALLGGVSEAVAAFFVGAAVSETEHKDRIESLLSPARDIFAAVFFFAIGLSTDPTQVLEAGTFLLVAVLVSIGGKLASGYLGGRTYDLSPLRSRRVAFALVTRGEFSLVVAAVAATAGSAALNRTIPAFAVGYVLVMSILGTLLMRYSGAIERLVIARPSAEGDSRSGGPD